MAEFPDTRESLILQVKDPSNRRAWEEFTELYQPVIFRIAVAKGMQHADAQDLSQQVLLAVSSAIGRWEKRPDGTPFRNWLSAARRQTNNQIACSTFCDPYWSIVGSSSNGRCCSFAISTRRFLFDKFVMPTAVAPDIERGRGTSHSKILSGYPGLS